MRTGLEIAFFASAGLLVYQQLVYPLVLMLLRALLRRPPEGPRASAAPGSPRPVVSLIIAAHDEEEVIAKRLQNALALDYPRQKLELIVASDGSADRTAERARAAGADLVLELPRGGKVAAQNAAVERSRGELLAFSDANSLWHPDALVRLLEPFDDPEVGYVCGQVKLGATSGDNQEGAYWRYEMALRRLESDLAGVTAGNGGIYATRRASYIVLEPSRSHDGSFPFQMAKRGWRGRYAPAAIAEEPMTAAIKQEFKRKRRIMRPLWDVVVRDGMLSPRGYRPLYAFQVLSNRGLRYAAPLLHLIALLTSAALAPQSTFFSVALALQIAVLVAAALASLIPVAPFRLARYYVSVMASMVAGLWDRFRLGPRSGWTKVEGPR